MKSSVGITQSEGLAISLLLYVSLNLRITMVYVVYVVEDFQTTLFFGLYSDKLRLSFRLGKLNFFINYKKSFVFLKEWDTAD